MDELIAAYQSLRAMLEDAVATWPDGVSNDIRSSIRVYLRSHCHVCGAVIAESRRRRNEVTCACCARPPLPAIRRGLAGEDDWMDG